MLSLCHSVDILAVVSRDSSQKTTCHIHPQPPLPLISETTPINVQLNKGGFGFKHCHCEILGDLTGRGCMPNYLYT